MTKDERCVCGAAIDREKYTICTRCKRNIVPILKEAPTSNEVIQAACKFLRAFGQHDDWATEIERLQHFEEQTKHLERRIRQLTEKINCLKQEERHEDIHRSEQSIQAAQVPESPAATLVDRQGSRGNLPDETSGWQPIETAPKDGRTLLLGRYSAGKWRTLRGQWYSWDLINEEWEEPEHGIEGWYETSEENDFPPNCWQTEPTHWMPLPKPPGSSVETSKNAPKRERPQKAPNKSGVEYMRELVTYCGLTQQAIFGLPFSRQLEFLLEQLADAKDDMLEAHHAYVDLKYPQKRAEETSGATPLEQARDGICALIRRLEGDEKLGAALALEVVGKLMGGAPEATHLAFRHWSKDPLIPYCDCHCDTCVAARQTEEMSEVLPPMTDKVIDAIDAICNADKSSGAYCPACTQDECGCEKKQSGPADLVGALQDVVHTDTGRVRAGRAVKAPAPLEEPEDREPIALGDYRYYQPEKVLDELCSCGNRMGEHPSQHPWWPCMLKSSEKVPAPSCGNPVMVNSERYRGYRLPSVHEGECSPLISSDNYGCTGCRSIPCICDQLLEKSSAPLCPHSRDPERCVDCHDNQ